MMWTPEQYTEHSLEDLNDRLARVRRQAARESKRTTKRYLELELEYIRNLISKIKSGELKVVDRG